MTAAKGTLTDTPDFEHTTNFKEFFLAHDAMANLNTELVFSIFKRYMCKAGCKMCYVQYDWMTDEQFLTQVPGDIPVEDERAILNAFEYFDVVTTMDDLYLLKHKYPTLYQFYIRNSHLMSSTAMSDIAFIQQFDIVMKEMNFKSIYELSFSDTFLRLNDNKNVDVVLARLNTLVTKYEVLKIKVILREAEGEEHPCVVKLIEWAKQHNIFTDVHDDILQQRNVRYELKRAQHQETNHIAVAGHVHLILCEVVYLQYTSMFLSISDGMSATSSPFFDVSSQQPNDPAFLSSALHEKMRIYKNNLMRIHDMCENISEKTNMEKYREYFQYVCSAVTVNNNFTFVPHFMLKPYSRLYKRLAEETFIDTKYGLLLRQPTPSTPIPIVSVTEKPRLRLEFIPIKNIQVSRETI